MKTPPRTKKTRNRSKRHEWGRQLARGAAPLAAAMLVCVGCDPGSAPDLPNEDPVPAPVPEAKTGTSPTAKARTDGYDPPEIPAHFYDPPELPEDLTVADASFPPEAACPTAFEIRDSGVTLTLDSDPDAEEERHRGEDSTAGFASNDQTRLDSGSALAADLFSGMPQEFTVTLGAKGGSTFRIDDEIRLTLTSESPGHFAIVTEGPDLLFPLAPEQDNSLTGDGRPVDLWDRGLEITATVPAGRDRLYAVAASSNAALQRVLIARGIPAAHIPMGASPTTANGDSTTEVAATGDRALPPDSGPQSYAVLEIETVSPDAPKTPKP